MSVAIINAPLSLAETANIDSAPTARTLPRSPSVEAMNRAERANRAALVRAARNASGKNILAFVQENFDAIEAQQRKANITPLLRDYIDAAIEAIDGKDPKAADRATRDLRHDAADFISKSPLAFADFDRTGLRMRPVTAGEIQDRIDRDAAFSRDAAASTRKLGQNASKAGARVGKALVATASFIPHLLMAGHYGIKATANAYTAAANAMRWGAIKRHAVLATVVGATFVPLLTPIDAAPYANLFAQGTVATDAFNAACKDPRVMNSTRLTAAFALGANTDNSIARMHYLSAMESLNYGISPVAAYTVSVKETGNFRDVVANNSSASGPYQSLTSVKLSWLSQYAQDTAYYMQAQERLANPKTAEDVRVRDESFVRAIDTTIADYRKDPKAMLASIDENRINLAWQTALAASNDPIFAGQLMGAELAARAPYLSTENLEGKSLTDVTKLIGRYYHTHLLGNAGASFLDYVVRAEPSTKMNDTAALQALYKKFKPGSDDKTAKYYAGYYKKVVASNGGVFKDGAGVTAQKFTGAIDTFVAQWAAPVMAKVQQGLDRGQNVMEICVDNPQLLAGVIPQTTTRLEVTGIQAANLYRSTVPAGIRGGIASGISYSWTTASQWISGTPKAEQPAATIEDIIGQTAGRPKAGLPSPTG